MKAAKLSNETKQELYEAIAKQMGYDLDKPEEVAELHGDLRDVANHGADTGWGGFTYTTDCVKFHDENEDAIWDLAREMAEEMGEPNVPALVAGFARSSMADSADGFKSLLAWFALEEVAREVSDMGDEEDDEASEED